MPTQPSPAQPSPAHSSCHVTSRHATSLRLRLRLALTHIIITNHHHTPVTVSVYPEAGLTAPIGPPPPRVRRVGQSPSGQSASRGRAMASWDGTNKCLGLDGLGTSFCNTCSTLGSHKGAWGRFQAVGWQICKSCLKSEDGVCYTYSSIGISICIIVSAPVPVPLPLPVSSRSCRRLQASSAGARRLACRQWAKEDEEQWPKEDEEKK